MHRELLLPLRVRVASCNGETEIGFENWTASAYPPTSDVTLKPSPITSLCLRGARSFQQRLGPHTLCCRVSFGTLSTEAAHHPALQMQAVQREAELLVGQLRAAASPQQQASAARALVAFCEKQQYGKEWSDAGGRAGVPAALVQAAKIVDAALQRQAVKTLGSLVDCVYAPENQSAAGAAGAIALVMQLAKSSDADLQRQAVTTLGLLVSCHPENQSAAGAAGAIALVMQLAKSSDAALQWKAVWTLGHLVSLHPENQSAAGAAGAVELMCNLLSTSPHPGVALKAVDTLNDLSLLASNASKAMSLGAVALLTQLKGRKGDDFDDYIVEVLAVLAEAK